MRKLNVMSARRDYTMGLSIAKRFHSEVSVIIDAIPATLDEANYFLADIGKHSFVAINLLFACELYLKIALSITGREPPESHDLWKLFKNLPAVDQQAINEEFLKEFAKYPKAFTGNLLLTQTPNLSEKEVLEALRLDEKSAPKGEYISLIRVLKDTKDSYLIWRYVYQSFSESKNHRVIRFHWSHLHCLCIVLERILKATIEKHQHASSGT